jgi:hypothetical protein
MAILETIAAANAAYEVIKRFAENGRETANLAKSVGQFLEAEDELKEQVSKRKSSSWAKALGKDANDFEEFWHMEQLAEKRKELEEYLRLYAKPGTLGKWQTFQIEARRRRKEARIAAEKAREERIELIVMILAIGSIVGAGVAGLWYIGHIRGVW